MPPSHGFLKRQKELKRQEKRQEKELRRQQRKEHRGDRPAGEDPDIAGIVPGPQPPRED